MRTLSFIAGSLALVSVQATAQVRPGDCRPVFPVADETAQIVPQDVITEQAPPPVLAQRRFSGLPFLIPGLFAAGLLIVLLSHGHDHHHETVSPA